VPTKDGPNGRQLGLIDIFRTLDPDSLAAIAPMVHWRKLAPKQTIVTRDDDTHDVFCIGSGSALVTIFPANGKEVTFRDLVAGETFGELSAIDGEQRSANVVAVKESDVGAISAADFQKIIRAYPDVSLEVMRKLVRLVRSLSKRVEEHSMPASARICADLLERASTRMISANVARLTPAPKHQDIANRVGTHREGVSRTMSELARKNILRRGTGELLILDVAALEQERTTYETE
jgi:CRP/FNR family transcriptional regulator, cyclic AMP receptor protein